MYKRQLIDAENDVDAWRFERSVDARFEGQLFELNLPIAAGEAPSIAKIETMFRATHRDTYGYDLTEHTVQLVNLRLVAHGTVHDGGWPETSARDVTKATRSRAIYDGDGRSDKVPVCRRSTLESGATLDGPLIVEDFGATIRILSGQTLEVRPSGVLILNDREEGR